AADELQAVLRIGRTLMACKSLTVEGLVKEHAGVIAGERPARAVRPVKAGRESDDEQVGATRAERRHGPRVVVGVILLHPVEVSREPCAVPAGRFEAT